MSIHFLSPEPFAPPLAAHRDNYFLLRAWRKAAIVGIVVASTVATPGTDLVSPIVLAVVLYGLYELSILLIRAGKR